MIKNIIFDFDGVILDSVGVKTEAFRKLFEKFSPTSVEQLLDYHRQNGGISRYVKIRYFFEVILNQPISQEEMMEYASVYSRLTREELANPNYIIEDTLQFIKDHEGRYFLHIASGADEEDLRYICDQLGLSRYFKSIGGSPQTKEIIIENILKTYHYNRSETCMLGDSVNDFIAAEKNKIVFFGFNNKDLQNMTNYLLKIDDIVRYRNISIM